MSRSRKTRSLLSLACLAAALGCGGEPSVDAEDGPPAPSETAPAPRRATIPANQFAEDFPSLTAVGNTDVWVAYQLWDGRGDGIRLKLLQDWTGEAHTIYASPTRLLGTAIASDETDTLHVVWSERVDDGWALRGVSVPAGQEVGVLGEVGEPFTLAHAPGAHMLEPVLTADESGRLLLAWLRMEGATMRIRARSYDSSRGWSEPVDVSRTSHSAWAPDAVALGGGRFAVAWDAAVDGDYDVVLARLRVGDDGRPVVTATHRVTDTPRYEVNPSLASAGDRLYVAYEVGPENWGREGSINKLEVALHDWRQVEIFAVEGDTRAPLAEPFMEKISESLGSKCDQPRIHVDASGNLLLFFRGLPLPEEVHDATDPVFQRRVEQLDGKGAGWRTSIWYSYMSRYDGRTWGYGRKGRHQQGLQFSNGRSDASLGVCALEGGGVGYAVVGDGRERETEETQSGDVVFIDHLHWWKPISKKPTVVHPGRIAKGAPVGPLPVGEFTPLAGLRDMAPIDTEPPRRRRLPDGTELSLTFGDLHRHTDLSRCSSSWDGPFQDAMRYSFDVGRLGFVAVTDHFEHMTTYDWWRTWTLVDAYHATGRMVNLRAYERADAATGHRNVISASNDLPLVAYRGTYVPDRDSGVADAPWELFEQMAGHDVITIPHTPAGMYSASGAVMDWLSFDPEFDRVVEVFQGYRGSSEAKDAPRALPTSFPRRFVRPALDGGLHFGLIAASDHQSSDGSFAGAWVSSVDRAGVYEALHRRRTFASTAKMSLWAEWNGVPMGVSARADVGATSGVTLDADGMGRELALVELIVDGEVVESRAVSGTAVRETFTGEALDVPESGTRYAYLRVHTADDELGWTSPTRLGADGWTGPDGPLGVHAFDERIGKALERGLPYTAEWQGPAGGERATGSDAASGDGSGGDG